MKLLKRFSLFLATLFLLSSFMGDGDRSYVGKWQGQDQGDIGFLTLYPDGYAFFEFEGQTMGGRSYIHQGRKAAMTYTVDTSRNPHPIDFIITDKEQDREIGRLRGIINMTSNDEMEMALTFGGGTNRPTDFSSDAIVFERYKD